MAASVWSASDAAINAMTLSNGGLTVTPSGSAWQSIRISSSKTSGKFYIEFANSAASSTADIQFGLASSGFDPSSYLGSSVYSGGSVINSGGNVVSAGFTGNYNPAPSPIEPVPNDVFSLAVDFTTGSMWLGHNNVWLGGSNPSTGSLPVISFVPATVGALFAGIAIYGANHGVWTLQPTAASQTYAPPAGFSAWDAPAGVTADLAGDLAPSLAFAADLTVVSAPLDYVDFTGNLGGLSSYGRLSYGKGHYSRIGAFAPIFAGNLDIVGQDFFAGDLAPVVTFSGALSIAVGSFVGDLAPVVTFTGDLTLVPYVDFAGNLTPVVTLGADLTLTVGLAGDLAPQIDLGASLTFDLPLTGDLPFTVTFAGSELTAGPLWASSEPCPLPPWVPAEPCPSSLWTPTEPCDPVDWEETELCNG